MRRIAVLAVGGLLLLTGCSSSNDSGERDDWRTTKLCIGLEKTGAPLKTWDADRQAMADCP